ncbi:MAG TPA: XdhC/CoxI family protein [Conexibacter sp.]|nr:XdhC/CoxI family protein [Conexibacter sp.]
MLVDGWLQDGRRVACALLVETEGSAPLAPGATMFVDEHGGIEGSLTGGCVEGAVVGEAEQVLAGGPPRTVTYGISDELAGTVGLTCGGTVHVFVHELDEAARTAELAVMREVAAGRPVAIATLLDGPSAGARLLLAGDRLSGSLGMSRLLDQNVARDAAGLLEQGATRIRRYAPDGAMLGAELRVHVRAFAPPRQLVVFGAIDFSAALAPLAKELGYAVTICDARERFMRSPRFARAAEVVVGWPQEVLGERTLGPRDGVLVLTHDPKFDEPALIAALETDAGYIGALGSRRTTEDRKRRLREAGVTDEQMIRIHAPCGLDIGAATPHEVAVSILAEMVLARTRRSGAPLWSTSGPIQPREQEHAAA